MLKAFYTTSRELEFCLRFIILYTSGNGLMVPLFICTSKFFLDLPFSKSCLYVVDFSIASLSPFLNLIIGTYSPILESPFVLDVNEELSIEML